MTLVHGVQTSYRLYLLFTLLLCSFYVTDLIKKLELRLLVVFNLLKIKLVRPKLVYRCQTQPVLILGFISRNYFYGNNHTQPPIKCSKLIRKSPERREFMADFERNSNLVLVFLLLTLSK